MGFFLIYFQEWTKCFREISFKEALKRVGVPVEGRSGIDDSRNLAKLVNKMVDDGVKLAITAYFNSNSY